MSKMDTISKRNDRAAKELVRLLEIMSRLRQPDGCPWDLKQNSRTLRPYLLEECHEVLEAIDSGDPDWLCEELGDLLLQVVFHAQIHSESSEFTMYHVVKGIADKMERRHPHVFAGLRIDCEEGLRNNWEKIKQQEKSEQKHRKTSCIPAHLPALQKAQKLFRHHDGGQGSIPPSLKALPAPLNASLSYLEDCSAEELREVLPDYLYSLAGLASRHDIDCEGALSEHLAKQIIALE